MAGAHQRRLCSRVKVNLMLGLLIGLFYILSPQRGFLNGVAYFFYRTAAHTRHDDFPQRQDSTSSQSNQVILSVCWIGNQCNFERHCTNRPVLVNLMSLFQPKPALIMKKRIFAAWKKHKTNSKLRSSVGYSNPETYGSVTGSLQDCFANKVP